MMQYINIINSVLGLEYSYLRVMLFWGAGGVKNYINVRKGTGRRPIVFWTDLICTSDHQALRENKNENIWKWLEWKILACERSLTV